jgi:hypothetical protein
LNSFAAPGELARDVRAEDLLPTGQHRESLTHAAIPLHGADEWKTLEEKLLGFEPPAYAPLGFPATLAVVSYAGDLWWPEKRNASC